MKTLLQLCKNKKLYEAKIFEVVEFLYRNKKGRRKIFGDYKPKGVDIYLGQYLVGKKRHTREQWFVDVEREYQKRLRGEY